jgi:MSHA pilin protein MshA
MLKKRLRNQKGFTLIEIIAVLVILGILAAIAIPKYLDLQGDARAKALAGAQAALISSASLDYSKGLLNASYTATSGPAAATGVVIGDYTGDYTAATAGSITATVTGGPTNWNTDLPSGANVAKVFKLY